MKKLIQVFLIFFSFISISYPQSWTPYGSGVEYGSVSSVVVYRNQLIAAGSFTTSGGTWLGNIAKWNGSSWEPLGSGIVGAIYAMTIYNDKVIVGGDFDTAGGVFRKYIACWDSTGWSSFGAEMPNPVQALTVFGGDLYAGTSNNEILQCFWKWSGSEWSFPGGGIKRNFVNAFTIYNGSLVLGGDFDSVGSTRAHFITGWNGGSFSTFGDGMNNVVFTLGTYGTYLLASGTFTYAGTNPANRIAKWNGSQWDSIGGGVTEGTMVISFYNYQGYIIAGGRFDAIDYVTAHNIAKWNGISWSPFGQGLGGYFNSVWSMCTYNNKLTAAGYFDTSGSVTVNNVAYWDHPIGIHNSSEEIPVDYVLYQNFPNPFNPVTTIKYDLPKASYVTLKVFDLIGRNIATLINENMNAGVYYSPFNGEGLSSGVYFYTLETKDVITGKVFKETRRMLLLK